MLLIIKISPLRCRAFAASVFMAQGTEGRATARPRSTSNNKDATKRNPSRWSASTSLSTMTARQRSIGRERPIIRTNGKTLRRQPLRSWAKNQGRAEGLRRRYPLRRREVDPRRVPRPAQYLCGVRDVGKRRQRQIPKAQAHALILDGSRPPTWPLLPRIRRMPDLRSPILACGLAVLTARRRRADRMEPVRRPGRKASFGDGGPGHGPLLPRQPSARPNRSKRRRDGLVPRARRTPAAARRSGPDGDAGSRSCRLPAPAA